MCRAPAMAGRNLLRPLRPYRRGKCGRSSGPLSLRGLREAGLDPREHTYGMFAPACRGMDAGSFAHHLLLEGHLFAEALRDAGHPAKKRLVPCAPFPGNDGMSHPDSDLPRDVVELDEVHAGAKSRKRNGGGPTGARSGRGPRRPLVLTAAVRGGEARFRRIESHGKADIGPAADAIVASAGTFMTDSPLAYSVLDGELRISVHFDKELARTDPDGGKVHVNTAGSCHADLRRMVLGV